MLGSSESWGPQQHPHPWHFRAGGGAVHSIKSGLAHCSKISQFDHLVGDGNERRRNSEPEGLCGLAVDHQLESGRRLHRQVGWFLTAQDAVDVARSLTEQLRDVDAIGQETAL